LLEWQQFTTVVRITADKNGCWKSGGLQQLPKQQLVRTSIKAIKVVKTTVG